MDYMQYNESLVQTIDAQHTLLSPVPSTNA